MTSADTTDTKDALRARCRLYRKALDEPAYRRLSSAIIDRAIGSSVFDDVDVVHIYWPMTDRHEVDTRPLIAKLQEAGKRLVIPAFDPESNSDAGRMIYRLFTSAERMQKNAWGTYEPMETNAVPPARVDVAVVPALGADRHGHRLGYGGGFYDRFLKEAGCTAVSLVYSECLFESVPHEHHDVRIGLIVTEGELIRPE